MLDKLLTGVIVVAILGGLAYMILPGAFGDSDKHGLVRVPPGRGIVELPEGKVGIWYRERRKLGTRGSGRSLERIDLPIPPGLEVVVRPVGSRRRIPQSYAPGSFQIGGTDDMQAQMYKVMEVPKAGRYAVRVSPKLEGRVDAGVGFGTPPDEGSLDRIGHAMPVMFGAIGFAIVMFLVRGFVFGSRMR